VNDRLA
jgi:hypothetical protein